jgi:hypothetical protein
MPTDHRHPAAPGAKLRFPPPLSALLLLTSMISCSAAVPVTIPEMAGDPGGVAGADTGIVRALEEDSVQVSGESPEQEIKLSVPGFLLVDHYPVPGGMVESIAPLREDSDGSRLLMLAADGSELRSSDGILVELPGIEPFWYFLFGLDSWMSPGNARLTLVYLNSGETVAAREYDLRIFPRDFRRITIPLNGRLTDIRTDQSPERLEQSRILSELLYRVDLRSDELIGDSSRRMPLESITHTSEFGDRRVYRYSDGNSATSIHNGLDFRAPVGEPVFAPLAGTVVMAETRLVTGNTVVLQHLPGVYSLYYHLDRLDVQTGVRLSPGDTLGLAGMTGLATGSHLHWEIRINGVAVDPEAFMAGALLDRQRLLGLFSSHHTKRW